MTRPASRVLALLELLQSGGTRTVAELAERLGVDERTVRRYVVHLHELDVPVESVRGRYGGYRLAPGYRLPPLMLSDDEALAALLALDRGEGDTAAGTAAAKIRRVLPERLARRLEALAETAARTGPPRGPEPPDAAVLLGLADAVRHHRPVDLQYTDRDGRPSARTLHPYGLVVHRGRWYVTGLDLGPGERRTFRVDRVRRVRPRPGAFRPPAELSVADEMLAGFATAAYRHEVTLHVRATPEQLRRRLPESVAVLTPGDDGWCRVEIRAESLDWIPAVLAALDHPFAVERPAELRDLVAALAGRLADGAERPTPGAPGR